MWVTKLLISPVKKGFFAQKRPNLAQNLHLWSIWAKPCRLIQCPVGGSIGGCGARAVSRKTPIYFMQYYVVPLQNYVVIFHGSYKTTIRNCVKHMYKNYERWSRDEEIIAIIGDLRISVISFPSEGHAADCLSATRSCALRRSQWLNQIIIYISTSREQRNIAQQRR